MERSDERAARNEATFREANEKIADRREELEAVSGPTPFICECENPACTELVHLRLEDYRAIRSRSEQFVVVPGHSARDAEPVREGLGWVCVRKHGVAAAVAREQDSRS